MNLRTVPRHVKLLTGTMSAFGFLLFVSCCAQMLEPALRARHLLTQLETLRVGKTTFEEAQRLANEMQAKPTGACDPHDCEWRVHTDNASIPRWWRGSGESFVVSFNLKDAMVVRTNIGYGVSSGQENFYSSSVGVMEEESLDRVHKDLPMRISGRSARDYPYLERTIYLTPRVSAEQRKFYTEFNFNCFWKYKGCKDARELLPNAASSF